MKLSNMSLQLHESRVESIKKVLFIIYCMVFE